MYRQREPHTTSTTLLESLLCRIYMSVKSCLKKMLYRFPQQPQKYVPQKKKKKSVIQQGNYVHLSVHLKRVCVCVCFDRVVGGEALLREAAGRALRAQWERYCFPNRGLCHHAARVRHARGGQTRTHTNARAGMTISRAHNKQISFTPPL